MSKLHFYLRTANLRVCLCRARAAVVAESAVADVPSSGVENEKKRKFQEKEDLQFEEAPTGTASHRRKLTAVSAVDDLSCYLGDEVPLLICLSGALEGVL